MTIHYLKSAGKNFGDALNSSIWNEFNCDKINQNPKNVLIGIGTLLDDSIYKLYPDAKYFACLGTGTGYGNPLRDMTSSKWVYRVVRGPLSAKALGLEEKEACTDGAILLALKPDYKPVGQSERHGVVFMPHHQALVWPFWEQACAEAGIGFLSPLEEIDIILETLGKSKLVIADAMHGAICADILRTPWLPAKTSKRINSFKWSDWTQSMSVDYSPMDLNIDTPSIKILRKIMSIKKSVLKDNKKYNNTSEPSSQNSTSNYTKIIQLYENKLRMDGGTFNKIVNKLKIMKGYNGLMSSDSIFENKCAQMDFHINKIKLIMNI